MKKAAPVMVERLSELTDQSELTTEFFFVGQAMGVVSLCRVVKVGRSAFLLVLSMLVRNEINENYLDADRV